ncbi:MAG: helix-turn-helix domain-containing protein, partial [Coriobacteriales bacterium]
MSDQLFATRLKQAMAARGLKQVDLLALAKDNGLKLGKSQLSQYVGGKTIPRESMLFALASMLGTTPGWLLGTDESAEQARPQAQKQPQDKPQP